MPQWPPERSSKSGAGTVLLSGDDTFSGLTTVYSGTLELRRHGPNVPAERRHRYRGRANPVRLHQSRHRPGDGRRSALLGTIYSSTLGSENALGWIDNGLVWPDHGVSEDASNVVVAYTLYGDANCDGTVNGTDLDLLAENWGQYSSTTTWAQGNFYNCPDPPPGGTPLIGTGDLDCVKPSFGDAAASALSRWINRLAAPPTRSPITRLNSWSPSAGTRAG